MSKFSRDSGEFISLLKGAKLTQAFRIDQIDRKKHKNFTISAFFGEKKLHKLLDNPDAIGLRIYYGLDIDGDGKRDKRFVIVAVDKEGNDILPSSAPGFNKDAAGEDILDDGVSCPYDCPKGNALNSDNG
ncbi:hypothetical protein [Chitinophaga sp. XS-30]|uniref:hypothetical protein n=1 Tax=Chitinophaga sp. XS-30 TaxID=2604421 RepID=UPI0011DD069C|nr:hypothetical protein [Chitinophaga sp. XS-30]QEH42369.1 hypothetical protein FW415_16425 [Chitinophaga sp. XS-30]